MQRVGKVDNANLSDPLKQQNDLSTARIIKLFAPHIFEPAGGFDSCWWRSTMKCTGQFTESALIKCNWYKTFLVR
jgi:hypothetical protein